MTHPALENVRRLVEWNRRGCAAGRRDASRPIQSVGILGAGVMGISIAAAHVRYGLPVIISDIDRNAIDRAPSAVEEELRQGGMECPAQNLRKLVRTSTDPESVVACDLIVEAIVENVSAKQELYARLREGLSDRTVVATNTSTIPLGQMAKYLPDPSRFCGLHFCHPVRERPLVEIVRGDLTSDGTLAAVVEHACRLERLPLVVRDGPGFVVNRLLFPYLGEALELLRAGVSAAAVEQAATDFGMARGPLRLMDEIGLDTTLHAGWVLAAAFPERIVASPLLVSLLKAGRRGQKTGAGFYRYAGPHGKALDDVPDPEAEKWLAPWRVSAPKAPIASLPHRLLLPMLLEATHLLADRTVEDPRDIDLAVLFGLGFPARQGGLLWWADSLGAKAIVAHLEVAAEPHLRPTELLESLAKTGRGFYDLRGSTL